ncbi:MAG: flagellar hook-length control protein FliK [Hydrogenophaga sp.]|nr:flagellar hook-length control protein FliK [Hydrogenophaga sp.]
MSTNATPPSAPGSQGTPAVVRNSATGQSGLQTRQAPADLFATLLAMAADAGGGLAADGSALADPLASDADTATPDADTVPGENPLAGLLMWQPPGLRDPAADHRLAGATPGDRAAALAAGGTPGEPKVEGSDTANPAVPATPAGNRPPALSWQVAATRAAQTQVQANAAHPTTGNGPTEAPAMRWTHAAAAADPGAAALSSRSTVAMDARYQPAPGAWREAVSTNSSGTDDSRPAGSAPGERLAVGSPSAAQQTDAGGGHTGGESETASGATTEAPDEASRTPEELLASESEFVEVQHWGTPTLRQASVRVGEDPGQAIDIQLALQGDELRLDIRTDDSAAREALREQAQAALGDRLAQGGLQLGSVSVGAQNQGQGREAPPQAMPTARQPAQGETEAVRQAPVGRTPVDGKPGLDLFI